MEYLKIFFEFIFPVESVCLLCHNDDEKVDNNICKSCRDKITIVDKEVCLNSSSIDKCYYTCVYDRFMKEVIKDFKFNDKSYKYRPLASLMVETIYNKGLDKDIDIIAFVPSHRRKEALRGYNQVELLAGSIAEELDVPLTKTLVKNRHTLDQHFLDRSERMENLKDAFRIKKMQEVKGKRILLIDDLITSGATFEECAGVLIKNEAKAVFSLALTSSRKL